MMFEMLRARTGCWKLAEDGHDVLFGSSSNASVNRDEKRVLLAGIAEPVLGVGGQHRSGEWE